MAPLVVEVRDVTKRFSPHSLALDGVSLTAAAGDFVAFIGPSGCGKSTLLRLIAGLIGPTEGQIIVEGTDPRRASSHLGFVFQQPTLLPWLSVRKNIELPLRLRGCAEPERTATVERVLSLTRLTEKGAARPRELSGGQQMRVSIARTLATRPTILLLDEPFGALDEMTREHLNEELLALHAQEQWTTFFVTHSVAEAVFLARRVLVFGANPRRIAAEVEVPQSYPRTAEFRHHPLFHETTARVSRLLRTTGANAA